jgi:hypothetical protein
MNTLSPLSTFQKKITHRSLFCRSNIAKYITKSQARIKGSETALRGTREEKISSLAVRFLQSTPSGVRPKQSPPSTGNDESESPNIVTLFSVECNVYFDWQTLGLVYSWRKSGMPGAITRLLSCRDEEFKDYQGMNLAPTLRVPNWSLHPRTNDR